MPDRDLIILVPQTSVEPDHEVPPRLRDRQPVAVCRRCERTIDRVIDENHPDLCPACYDVEAEKWWLER